MKLDVQDPNIRGMIYRSHRRIGDRPGRLKFTLEYPDEPEYKQAILSAFSDFLAQYSKIRPPDDDE